jgi:hypothetical protein
MAGRLRSSRILFNPFCSKAQPYAGLYAFQEIIMTETHDIASDNQIPLVPVTGLESWFEKDRDYARRASELLLANKAVLFDRLAAAGITSVNVNFDGYGDSGQIEGIEAKAGDEAVELPDDRIEIIDAIWGSGDLERQTVTIHEAIEVLAYSFLRQTHEGWENNDGAFGDFTFDVAERSIMLEYNERYTETNYSEHVF